MYLTNQLSTHNPIYILQTNYPRIALTKSSTHHIINVVHNSSILRSLRQTVPASYHQTIKNHTIHSSHQPIILWSHQLSHPRITPLMYITTHLSTDHIIQVSLHLTIQLLTNHTIYASHHPTIQPSQHLYVTNQLSTHQTIHVFYLPTIHASQHPFILYHISI